MVRSGRVGCTAEDHARRTRPGWHDRLVKNLPGLRKCPGEKGGDLTGPNPTDRGKRGTKYHVLTDRNGLPLHVEISGANRHDSMLVEPVLDNITAIKGVGRGRPRRRPVIFHADKAYDNRRVRCYLRCRGIKARIARIGVDSKQ
uniref:C.xyli insertion sequence IS1237 n=1 Tax=Leifsonia xyli TaxID=1575 RepID=Q46487_9MICO|nr:unnamed protein product [Leifsonia xyli subsp. cynodontis]